MFGRCILFFHEGKEVIEIVRFCGFGTFIYRDFRLDFSAAVFFAQAEEIVKFAMFGVAVCQRCLGLVFFGEVFQVAEEVVVFAAIARGRCGNRGWFFRRYAGCGYRFVCRNFQIFEEIIRQLVGRVRFAIVIFVAVFRQPGEFFVEFVQFGKLRVEAIQSINIVSVGRCIAYFDFAYSIAAVVRIYFSRQTIYSLLRKFFDAIFVIIAALAFGNHVGGCPTERQCARASCGKQR